MPLLDLHLASDELSPYILYIAALISHWTPVTRKYVEASTLWHTLLSPLWCCAASLFIGLFSVGGVWPVSLRHWSLIAGYLLAAAVGRDERERHFEMVRWWDGEMVSAGSAKPSAVPSHSDNRYKLLIDDIYKYKYVFTPSLVRSGT